MARRVQLAATLLATLFMCSAGADDAITAQRDAADDRYREYIAAGQNADAAAAGLEVLTLTQQLHGDASIELAGPLTNLATAQLRNGDYRDAEANYQAAIALLEKHEGFLSMRLINPLVGLGETHLRDEQYALATKSYERALHINHVNDGLYNPDQGTIRDGLTEGYLGLGQIELANVNQDALVYANQRRLGPKDPALVGALRKLARWYDRSNQPEQARVAYQNAAQIAAETDPGNTQAEFDLLLEIAATYRRQALLPADPDAAQSPGGLLALASLTLRNALAVVDRQQPPDPAQRARAYVELGDVNLLLGKRKSAADHYRDAWLALSADQGLLTQRDQYFAAPERVTGPIAPRIFPVPARNAPPPARKNLEPGFVVVRFDVDASGRAINATVIEADPANLLEKYVADAVTKTIYRPRLEDAEPVATTGVIVRHDFRYAPTKLAGKSEPPPDEGNKPLEQPTSGGGS